MLAITAWLVSQKGAVPAVKVDGKASVKRGKHTHWEIEMSCMTARASKREGITASQSVQIRLKNCTTMCHC